MPQIHSSSELIIKEKKAQLFNNELLIYKTRLQKIALEALRIVMKGDINSFGPSYEHYEATLTEIIDNIDSYTYKDILLIDVDILRKAFGYKKTKWNEIDSVIGKLKQLYLEIQHGNELDAKEETEHPEIDLSEDEYEEYLAEKELIESDF